MPYVNRADAQLHYLEAGPREAQRVVLFLHSLGADHRLWRPQVEALQSEVRILAPDSRGHGKSTGGRQASVDIWVEDIHAVVEAAGVQRVDVVGVSMGGVQAMAYAHKYPGRVRSLVLADTFASLEEHLVEGKVQATGGAALKMGMEAYADLYIEQTLKGAAEADAARLREAIAGMDPESYAAAARACFSARLDGVLPEIQAPTLVLIGAEDQKTPIEYSRRIAHAIPGAQLQVLPRAGHLSNLDNPEAFTQALRDFWKTS